MFLKVFVCSTYVDLIEERKAVMEAIKMLRQKHESMEYFGAHDDQPNKVCMEEVSGSDILVVIVGHLYGSLAPDKEISFSQAEYEEAQRLGKQCLVYIRHKDVETENIEQDPQKRELLEKWKATLNEWHTVYLFKNINDLAVRVTADLSREIIKRSIGILKPNLGRSVCKYCDRSPQLNSFWEFFLDKSERYPHRPQFYVIHGKKEEAHESFIQVIKERRLQKYFENKKGSDEASIYERQVSWPDQEYINIRKKNLQMNLFGESITKDYLSTTLSQLEHFRLRCAVIIKHNLASWDENDESLIRWYLEEYWGNLQADDNIPLFLIFFKIQYKDEDKKSWLNKIFGRREISSTEIIKKLKNIQVSSKDDCPIMVIDELTPVRPNHVEEWFNEHMPNINVGKYLDYINSFFQGVDSKSMALIENFLEDILNEYRRKKGISYG